MTIYVTGGGGGLGRAFAVLASRAADRDGPRHVAAAGVTVLTRRDLDITDPDAVRSFGARLRAGDVVVNAAAYTAVDAAESDEPGAVAGNVTGPQLLAGATAAARARLVHVSTDYVFAATPLRRPLRPTDDAAPAGVYGTTKAAGEAAVRAADPRAVIARTAWLYTGRPPAAGGPTDFVTTMRRLAAERDTVSVVDDQRGSPTSTADLARGLLELAAAPDVTGVTLHAVNAGDATWCELARAVFAGIGAAPERVRPCTTAEFPRPAPRPAYSVLDATSWPAAGLTPLRPWQEALAAALAAR